MVDVTESVIYHPSKTAQIQELVGSPVVTLEEVLNVHRVCVPEQVQPCR